MKKFILTLLLLIGFAGSVFAGTYFEAFKYDLFTDIPKMIKEQRVTDAYWLADEWCYEIDRKYDDSFHGYPNMNYKPLVLAIKLSLLPGHYILDTWTTQKEKYDLFYNDSDAFYDDLFVETHVVKEFKPHVQQILANNLEKNMRSLELTYVFQDYKDVDMYIGVLLSILRFITDEKAATTIENTSMYLSRTYCVEKNVYYETHLRRMLDVIKSKRQMIKK